MLKGVLKELHNTAESQWLKIFVKSGSNGLGTTVKKNILWSIAIKILATALMFIIIKVNYSTLNIEKYGVWSTIYSLVSWIVFLDIGISQGTRNLLTEALARNDMDEARRITATSYILLGLVSIVLITILGILPINLYSGFINLRGFGEGEVVMALQIITFFVILNFTCAISYSVLYALQKSALVNVGPLLINILTLTVFLIFHWYRIVDLRAYAVALGSSFVVSSIVMTFLTFYGSPEIIPRMMNWEIKLVKPILKIGFYFFLLQGLTVFIVSYVRILIFNFNGPVAAAKFDLYNRLYSVINMAALLITAPLWSAFTHAYTNNDLDWIKRVLSKLNKLMLALAVCSICLAVLSKPILMFWIKKSFPTDEIMNCLVLFTTLLITWITIYATLSNGINNLKPQLTCLAIGAVINYPLSYLFSIGLGLKEHGVILGEICSLSIYAVYIPLQTRKFALKSRKR